MGKILLKVISTPSLNNPCKVFSSPNCTVNNQARNCENEGYKKTIEFRFPAEKTNPRNTKSCICISTENLKNEYCFHYPIPREVVNYYNRLHMRAKCCKNPISCCPQTECLACSCRKYCTNEPSKSCNKPCSPPKKYCCPPPPQPCTPTVTRYCGCCVSTQPDCNDNTCCPPSLGFCQCYQSAEPGKPTSCCRRSNGCCSSPKKCCRPPNSTSVKCCPHTQCCQRFCRQMGYPICGQMDQCNCKMSEVRAQCTVCCNRCGQKVYAAEKILVSCGAYHTSCFTCYCCNKCLDVKNVFEGCGEIYCKQCYNCYFGVQFYGFGTSNC
ncbi:hypothetical protein ABEB36_007666 [Hypothenemus hampei]|uniref:LIM zinc-binding domain-containing protein n=1 Tax=Hypothenemus hampei TaxID=57062 RepID=A0ABD1EYN9_HYPHA